MEAKIKTDLERRYINKGIKYYNMDSFFGMDLRTGLGEGITVAFLSKYGDQHNLYIDLKADNIQDAKKELEEFLELSDEEPNDDIQEYSQYRTYEY